MFSDLLSKWQNLNRLAWRSVWRHKRRTIITLGSISLGLTFAIFFIAMGEGVYRQMINDGVRIQAGHITLEHPAYRDAPAVDLWISGVKKLRHRLNMMDGVERTKVLLWGQGVAKSSSGAVGVAVMGVEPSEEARTSPLAQRIVAGSFLTDDDDRKVVVGLKLAQRLKVKEGKKLVITTNDASGDLVEELCRVKGIFQTGSEEIDSYFIQIPLNFARRLFGLSPDSATQLGVLLENTDEQARKLREIKASISGPDTAVLPWQKVLPELSAYIKVDRASNWIFQSLLIMVILFTIFNTLLMSAVEREREFAVLLALGASPRLLKNQLIMESAWIGLMGCGLGMVLGALAAGAMQIWGIDLGFLLPEGATVSGLAISTHIYSRLTASILFWAGGIVFGATLLLSFVPMRRINRIPAADTLR